MKNKQLYLTRGSFALLLFMILGYTVKFHSQQLTGFDTSIQTALRGDLPQGLTVFFSTITSFINTPVIVSWVLLVIVFFLFKKWRSEAILLFGNLVASGLLVLILKNIYQRPRPAIQHLVEESGFSFPSGHALASTLVFGSLIIIVGQHIHNKVKKRIVQGLFLVAILTIVLSRVYLGVHYPTDVTASMLLGFSILSIEFPFYDQLRFQWRFKGKQR